MTSEELGVIVDKFVRDTEVFVNTIKAVMHDVELEKASVNRERETLLKERADIIKRANTTLAQVDSMRIERDDANNKVRESEKLREVADQQMVKVNLMREEIEKREHELEQKLAKVAQLEEKEKSIEKKIGTLNEVEQMKESLAIKENFIRKEQALLYEKQKSLEIREDKLKIAEERVRRLHGN